MRHSFTARLAELRDASRSPADAINSCSPAWRRRLRSSCERIRSRRRHERAAPVADLLAAPAIVLGSVIGASFDFVLTLTYVSTFAALYGVDQSWRSLPGREYVENAWLSRHFRLLALTVPAYIRDAMLLSAPARRCR